MPWILILLFGSDGDINNGFRVGSHATFAECRAAGDDAKYREFDPLNNRHHPATGMSYACVQSGWVTMYAIESGGVQSE